MQSESQRRWRGIDLVELVRAALHRAVNAPRPAPAAERGQASVHDAIEHLAEAERLLEHFHEGSRSDALEAVRAAKRALAGLFAGAPRAVEREG